MMEVIALERGFFGGAPRAVGERFEVPEGSKARWFAPVDSDAAKAKPVAAKKAKAESVTLSQVAKEEAKSFVDVVAQKNDLA